MTGDSTGEIYVLVAPSGTPTATTSGTIVTATGQPNAGTGVWRKETTLLSYGLAGLVMAALMV